ncbi:MAG: glycosyltransferase family 4 protein [Magnetococcales bacterium]|nr:glycosyltransferase family 4 protein [Magnetococcales bacterium]
MVKLALIRQRYNPFGGAERFLERAMEALRAQGVEITLIARQWETGMTGITPVSCNPFHLGRWWRDAGFARAVERLLQGHTYHLTQTHERIPGCDIYRAGDGVHAEWLHQRGMGQTPFARRLALLNPYHRYVLNAERRLFEHPGLRAVICNSRMVREEILARFRIDPGKLHVIYNGVDTGRFHPDARAAHRERVRREWGISDGEVCFLFVGSGFARKGVAVLLHAMARLPAGCRLLVAGRDKEQARMTRLATQLGLRDRVAFAGGCKEVIPLYAAADAVVLPTLYDPFPNVALEAMAMGLPLVTSPKCGAVDLIEPGKNGLLAAALDPEDLARQLACLLDPVLRDAMGRAARETIAPFTLEAMGGQLVALYQELLRKE